MIRLKTHCRDTTTDTFVRATLRVLYVLLCLVLPWLFPLTSCVAPVPPSRLLLLLHQHRTAGRNWPPSNGCDACPSLRSAGPRGPAVQQGAPLGQNVSHHLLDSRSCFVCGCRQCEADGPGSPSAMSNSETEKVRASHSLAWSVHNKRC